MKKISALEFFENHFSKSPGALIIVFVDTAYPMYTQIIIIVRLKSRTVYKTHLSRLLLNLDDSVQ